MIQKGDQFGECRLCGQQAKLCRSHVVPEFCYARLYDPNHRTRVINLKLKGYPSENLIQKGLREHLLCSSCEQCISKYEHKFKSYWYDSPGLPERMDLRYGGIQMSGADYASMKLFHLSVLWRAGEAKWCRKVSLGPYAAKIGKMLLSGDPGVVGTFPVFGTVLVDRDGTVKHEIITEPVRSRVEHTRAYFMCYGGCEWTFVITDHPTPAEKEVARGIDASGNVWLTYSNWLESNSVKIMRRYPLRK